jgi:molybdopterin-containing oxidoreductase family membrane subunit
MAMVRFLGASVRQAFRGGPVYWAWLVLLFALIANGLWHYAGQVQDGLIVTNLSSQVSWGFYIANFAFLVGVAAAAVLLVVPAYIFHREDVKDVVLLGDTMAIAAVLMAILFVVVDLGRPDRIWHLLPGIGVFNFPVSMLAWDVVVLSGYLVLNVGISFYILFSHYRGRQPRLRVYFPFVLLAMFWAISIHTVTAFLFSANSGRPFWHNPLLAPRFIASAFASGPALSILVLLLVRRTTSYPVHQSAIDMLAITMGVALQVTLFFVGAELFTEFYNEGHHAISSRYLFFGLNGQGALVPWIWTGVVCLLSALVIMMIHPLRQQPGLLGVACVLTAVGVWLEKGMAMVVPGFVPTPLGEVFEYLPNATEVSIALGVWGIGVLVFTLLAKAGIAVECGHLREGEGRQSPGACESSPATVS